MKKYIWWLIIAAMAAGGIYWYNRSKAKAGVELFVTVERGEFEVLVITTGELQAKNFENIYGPNFQTNVFRWSEYKIQDIVPEGTLVKKGDFVAEIDRTTAKNAMLEMEERIQRQEETCETVHLDTAINLRGLRDDLLNREAILEEMRLKLESSIYEPPATIRMLEFELERTERALEQQRRLYVLRERNYQTWMHNTERALNQLNTQYEKMQEVISGFTVHAPNNGMVIYYRERNNQKRRAGSTINPSNNVVAQLPDLSKMMSRTYVNEIDISKIKVKQEVRIGVDAFPEKSYTGVIVSVSNIGEQLSGTDAKVFEVMVEINESDPILRPSMTTSNQIVINSIPDVTYVAIDVLHIQDNIPFVYTANQTRQIVLLGEANDTEIIVEQGLTAGDVVYLSVPEKPESWKILGEELIPIIKERAEEKKNTR